MAKNLQFGFTISQGFCAILDAPVNTRRVRHGRKRRCASAAALCARREDGENSLRKQKNGGAPIRRGLTGMGRAPKNCEEKEMQCL